MYQVCPICRKLFDDDGSGCPHCGSKPKSQRGSESRLWWCNYCNMFVDPSYSNLPRTPEGTGALVAALFTDNVHDAIQYVKISSLEKKSSDNPDGLRCPKCGGTDLVKESKKKEKTVVRRSPLELLQIRLINGEITKEEFLELKKLIQ